MTYRYSIAPVPLRQRHQPNLPPMPISVLICDDLPSVQGMLRRMLERDDFTIVGMATSADEVLKLYEATHPDLVLLDYRMPGAAGLSVLLDLLAIDPLARVVMFSGMGDPDLQSEAMAEGAVDWILKPIYPATFIARLRELMDRHPRPGRIRADSSGQTKG
jgi:two-component system chemotaxis response regulator CheY